MPPMQTKDSVVQSQVKIKASDGVAGATFFHPAGPGAWPGVIIYMDAFGPRPALYDMASRLASHNYSVLLPDLFYRSAPYAPLSPADIVKEGPERTRLMQLVTALNPTLATRDTAAYLDFLKNQKQVSGDKVGVVGYCMGGGMALAAAGAFPGRVAAAASFHGGRLATDAPDSPHLLAPKIHAKVYIGIAGIDPHFTPQEKERLETALKSAHIDYKIEVYEGVRHGFAVTDHGAYDKPASERHWKELLELFDQTLHEK
jgi:carboxymethylenebutenolidase